MYNRRSNRIQLAPVTQYITIFTGGYNDRVSNLELKPGELYACSNYIEYSGRYNGYSSVKGMEVYDGKALASSKVMTAVPDEGGSASHHTTALVESTNGVTPSDLSRYSRTISSDVAFDTTKYYFSDASYLFNGTSQNITFTNDATYNWSDTSSVPDDGNLKCIDLIVQVTTSATVRCTFASKNLSWEVGMDATGKVYLNWWESSVKKTLTTSAALTNGLWYAIRVTKCADAQYRIFLNGILEATSVGALDDPDTNSNDVIVGYSATATLNSFFWLDTFRMFTNSASSTADYEVADVAYSSEGFFAIDHDDSLVEEHRATITKVTTATATEGDVLATHVLERSVDNDTKKVVAIRKNVGAATVSFHHDTGSGWVRLATLGADPTNASIKMTTGRFAEPTLESLTGGARSAGDYANKELLFLTISTDPTNLFYFYDGTAIYAVSRASVIAAGGSGIPTNLMPIDCYCHDNRLFLIYTDGEMYISDIGDPLIWDITTTNAEFYDFPFEINDVQHIADNTVAVFLDRGIYMMKGSHVARSVVSTGWLWEKHAFNEVVDVVPNTVQRFGSTIYFCTKQGVMSLNTSDVYGSFSQDTLSSKVNGLLLPNLDNIVGSSIQKDQGQYRIYFSNSAIYFTIREDGKFKGTTPINYDKFIADGDTIASLAYSPLYDETYFGASNGYLYKVDSGTSWNGSDIVTKFKSAFNPFTKRLARKWKHLHSVLFEADVPTFLPVTAKIKFGYDRSDLPQGEETMLFMKGQGGVYGIATTTYSSFIWGGSVVGNPMFYLYGQGVNFSIEVSTSSRAFAQHTIQNAISDYQIMGRQT